MPYGGALRSDAIGATDTLTEVWDAQWTPANPQLYPDWKFTLTEDQWGYTATWQCPGRPATTPLVTLGQHRSPTLTVAMARACLVAIQNMRRYEERRQARLGAARPAPEKLEREQSG